MIPERLALGRRTRVASGHLSPGLRVLSLEVLCQERPTEASPAQGMEARYQNRAQGKRPDLKSVCCGTPVMGSTPQRQTGRGREGSAAVGATANGDGISLQAEEELLELDRGGGCATV